MTPSHDIQEVNPIGIAIKIRVDPANTSEIGWPLIRPNFQFSLYPSLQTQKFFLLVSEVRPHLLSLLQMAKAGRRTEGLGRKTREEEDAEPDPYKNLRTKSDTCKFIR